jgi:hypothetical protein
MAGPGRAPGASRSSRVMINRAERSTSTSSAEWSVLVFVTVTCVSINRFPSVEHRGVECFGRSCQQCLSALGWDQENNHPASAFAPLHLLPLPITFLGSVSTRFYYYFVLQQIVKGHPKTKLAANSYEVCKENFRRLSR